MTSWLKKMNKKSRLYMLIYSIFKMDLLTKWSAVDVWKIHTGQSVNISRAGKHIHTHTVSQTSEQGSFTLHHYCSIMHHKTSDSQFILRSHFVEKENKKCSQWSEPKLSQGIAVSEKEEKCWYKFFHFTFSVPRLEISEKYHQFKSVFCARQMWQTAAVTCTQWLGRGHKRFMETMNNEVVLFLRHVSRSKRQPLALQCFSFPTHTKQVHQLPNKHALLLVFTWSGTDAGGGWGERLFACFVNYLHVPPGGLMCVLFFLPVSELWAQCEVMSKEVLLRWDGPLQPEEGVVLHAGLPQVLTGPIVHHVETQQRLPSLSLSSK